MTVGVVLQGAAEVAASGTPTGIKVVHGWTTYSHYFFVFEGDIFWHPCYVWYQAVQQDFFPAVRLVHSLLKCKFILYFSCEIEFKFTKYSNLIYSDY